ncbi:Poxvirus protein I5 [Arthrobacter globiformis]|uniref:Poxvirus protein I5 n=1 Tax=Arthrobacter globiformis TaxID=1665 RepID=UPI0027826D04|nr:Poxvirus protein I5 [Arthrobacter globiformis]MDQ0866698.1 putative membrane protein YesL [Arthrobacter globiformis]
MTAETESVPVNRFALFSETMLAGIIVLALSVPLVTVPAAYAAGTAHLGRHLSGRDDSVRSLWGTFRSALPGSQKLGFTTAAVAAVVIINLLLAAAGQLPGRAVVLPATLLVAAAAAVLLLRTASRWQSGAWAEAVAAARTESLADWCGSLLLVAALGLAAVFVWMLPALVIVVPGCLVLAAAAVRLRAEAGSAS